MKPRTKQERAVQELFLKRYPNPQTYVSRKFEEWVRRKIMKPVVFSSGRKGWCLSCGKELQCDASLKTVTCPHCHREAIVQKTRKQHSYSISYLQELDIVGEWQVINTYTLQESYNKGHEGRYWIDRVYTWFINEKDDRHLFSAGLKMFSYKFENPWYTFHDGLHMRKPSPWSRNDYFSGWKISGIYPHAKVLDFLRKRGLKGSTRCIEAFDLIRALRYNSKVETLWKAGQYGLADHCIFRHINDSDWASVKVAMRHGFNFRKLDNTAEFFDHLSVLRQLGLDSLNPKYICPRDFATEHRLMNERLQRKQERERRERERLRALEEAKRNKEAADPNSKINIDYRKRLGGALAVEVHTGSLTLKPLQTIRDFMDAGNTLHHCVYSGGYYHKANCLIIAATVSGQLMETIEIDMQKWEIKQCRGVHNQPSPHHDAIMEAMQNNMNKYKRAKLSKRKSTDISLTL